MNPHWKLFRTFARQELGVGGPDAQLALTARYVADYPPKQRVWMAGIYCAHHTSPSAIAVFEFFPKPIHAINNVPALREFLTEYWDQLPLRREMRSHRMLDKRVDCLLSFARYTRSLAWKEGKYEDVWNSSIKEVQYYGRYMALKYLELLRMMVRPELTLHDLRAKHAWSPRIALAMLYPLHADILLDRKDNSSSTIAYVERLAASLHRYLLGHGIQLNFFQLQVLLCNYKQTTLGRFYPGMGLDEELEYARTAKSVTSMKRFFAVRQRMYDKKHLGELSGWSGIRESELHRWKRKGARLHDDD